MPVGADLKRTIAEQLNIQFEPSRGLVSGDTEVAEALRLRNKRDTGTPTIGPYQRAGWLIRDAMPAATSIDHFLDAHQDNPHINYCGKVAITRSILAAERNSHLFPVDSALDLRRVESTWYILIIRMLVERQPKKNIGQLFENLSFITFNYDRCIEFFLFSAIQIYYGVPPDEAKQVLNTLQIYHPYGSVGNLPPLSDKDTVDFGMDASGAGLGRLADRIKTFHERVDEDTELQKMRKLVQEADRVVFLGFGFHPQNLELIKPAGRTNVRQAFATASGISKVDCLSIASQIRDVFHWSVQKMDSLELRNDLKCADLLREYSRRLSQ